MTYTIPKEAWLSFEAEMITHTHLNHIMPFKWEISADSAHYKVGYEIPPQTYTLTQMIENNHLNMKVLNALIATLIDLNQLLHSYMLSNKHILYHPEDVYYSMQFGKFYFYYLPDESHKHDFSVLELIRHLVIEMDQFHLMKNLKTHGFDLEALQTKLLEPQTSFWQKLIKSSKNTSVVEKHRTPQKHVYPLLLDRYNPTSSYKLYFEHNTIGRDEQSNVFLDDLSISRNHGIIYKSGRQFIYKDLLSTNGSKINGNICETEHAVVNGDIIQIGEKEFIFIR